MINAESNEEDIVLRLVVRKLAAPNNGPATVLSVMAISLPRNKSNLLPLGKGFDPETCAVPVPGVPVIVTTE
jgi:hypothetical protein